MHIIIIAWLYVMLMVSITYWPDVSRHAVAFCTIWAAARLAMVQDGYVCSSPA